ARVVDEKRFEVGSRLVLGFATLAVLTDDSVHVAVPGTRQPRAVGALRAVDVAVGANHQLLSGHRLAPFTTTLSGLPRLEGPTHSTGALASADLMRAHWDRATCFGVVVDCERLLMLSEPPIKFRQSILQPPARLHCVGPADLRGSAGQPTDAPDEPVPRTDGARSWRPS